MRYWKKILSVLLAGIMCCLVAAGCSSKKEEGLTKLNVCEVTHSLFYAPQYVAISEGFFAEEGLELELSNGGGADKVMAAILSGDMDIGLAGPEASIYVYNEGKEDHPQVFAQLTKRDGSFLVAKEDIQDFTWDDIKGKTVIPGRKGGVPYMTLEYIIKENGIDPATETTLDDSIQFDLMAGAFSSGTADFVTLFEPTASMIEQEGKGHIVCSIGTESGEIPYTAYCAKQSYMEENPEIIQGFTNAVAKGQQWVKEHTAEEIAESIVDFFPDTDVETLSRGLQSYIDADAWNATPVMKKEAFQRLQDVMISAGELSEYVPFEEIINNSYAEKVN